MMKKWTVHDRYGNEIYLTEERWHHILEARPELEPCLEKFLETVQTGLRKQDTLIPNEYRYFKQFDELLPENNHIIAVVIFKTQPDDAGNYITNNFVITGWAKYIVPKR
jgi:hypothetical protein